VDVATLGLRIDSTQTQEAGTALDRLGATGERSASRVKTAWDGTNATMARLTQEAARTRASLAQIEAAERAAGAAHAEAALRARQVAEANGRLVAGLTAAGRAAHEASAGARAWAAGLARLQGQQQAVATSATGAASQIGRLREPLTSLAGQAAGVAGPLGQVGSLLLSMSVGGPVTVAAVAGLAVLAGALTHFSKQAREARRAYEDYVASLTAASPLAVVGRKIDTERASLRNPLFDFGGNVLSALGIGDTPAERQRQLAEAQALYQNMLEGFAAKRRQVLEESRRREEESTRTTTVQTEAVRVQAEAVRVQAGEVFNLARAWEALDRASDEAIRRQQQATRLFTISSVTGRTPAAAGPVPTADFAPLDRLADRLGDQTVTLLRDTEGVRDAWVDTARAAVGFAQALGGVGEEMALLAQNALTFGSALDGALTKLRNGGSLSGSEVFGLFGAGLGVLSSLSGLFGESEAQRRHRELLARNNEVLQRLTDRIGDLGLGISGTQFGNVSRGIDALTSRDLLGANPFGPINRPLVDAILKGAGSSLADLEDVARIRGITLDPSSTERFIDSLRQLDAALKETELTRFAETFAGRMQALNAQWQIFNTQDPLQRLAQQLRVAAGAGITRQGGLILPGLTGLGSPALAGAASGLDLSTAAGRSELLGNLQDLFLQLQSGTLDASALGGLTAQEFLDQLTSLTGLLFQIEEEARARDETLAHTVDTLRAFQDALRLDRSLTTLSPVQQLAEARRQYDRALAAALGGDQQAALEIPELARQLLEASRAVNASGPAYAADFQRVLEDADRLAERFDGMRSVSEQQLEAQQAMRDGIASLLGEQQATVAVLQSGLQQTVAKLDQLVAEVAENTRVTKRGAP
jgi:hypothetical protein